MPVRSHLLSKGTPMKDIVSEPQLVGYCGLYCGACKAYLKDKCPGCQENQKATWCKVRSCCISHQYSSCADCAEITEPSECKLFNNLIAKIFGLAFRSDRAACVRQIRVLGIQGHADNMAESRRHTIKK